MGMAGLRNMNFTTMYVDEESVPFIDFHDSGLRNCTLEIKKKIEKLFNVSWFRNHEVLDLTPKTLSFICLISVVIPEIDFGLCNAPWEPKIASKIY